MTIKGNIILASLRLLNNWAPITIAAHEASDKDPKRSAPIPAISPTLSPTLSAIVAGFLGESSGKSFSYFPTRSAPTSAALV